MVVISVLLVTSIVSAGASDVATVGSATGWTVVPAEHVAGQADVFRAVVAPAAGDVWAIGYAVDNATPVSKFHTLAEHINGDSFEIVPTPDPASANNRLDAAAASAPDDVWAVGSSAPDILHSDTLIEHWNGTAWSIVDGPSPSGSDLLQAVTVVSRDDAWAGGSSGLPGAAVGLALHWDGVQWKQVRVPVPARCGGDSQITGMSAVSATSVWASGWCATSGAPDAGYVIHWDGKAWRFASRGQIPTSSELLAIHARNDHDVWTVGQYVHGAPLEASGMSAHWDGKSWSAPAPAPGAIRLDGVEAGSRGVWSVGAEPDAPFAPPWSGRFTAGAWHAKPVRVKIGYLPAITTDAAGRLWAAGAQDLDSGDTAALVLTR